MSDEIEIPVRLTQVRIRYDRPGGFLFREKHVQNGDVVSMTEQELAETRGRWVPIEPEVPPSLMRLAKREHPFRDMMLRRSRRDRGMA